MGFVRSPDGEISRPLLTLCGLANSHAFLVAFPKLFIVHGKRFIAHSPLQCWKGPLVDSFSNLLNYTFYSVNTIVALRKYGVRCLKVNVQIYYYTIGINVILLQAPFTCFTVLKMLFLHRFKLYITTFFVILLQAPFTLFTVFKNVSFRT